MHKDTDRSRDSERNGACDRMADLYEFDPEAAYFDGVACLNAPKVRIVDTVLMQLVVDERKGEFCAVNGRMEFLKGIGDCSDMILMPVGDYECAELILVELEIGHIRYYHVYAQHILIGERKPAVNCYYVIAVFDYGYIFSDFSETAKRDYSQLRSVFLCQIVYIPFFLLNKIMQTVMNVILTA